MSKEEEILVDLTRKDLTEHEAIETQLDKVKHTPDVNIAVGDDSPDIRPPNDEQPSVDNLQEEADVTPPIQIPEPVIETELPPAIVTVDQILLEQEVQTPIAEPSEPLIVLPEEPIIPVEIVQSQDNEKRITDLEQRADLTEDVGWTPDSAEEMTSTSPTDEELELFNIIESDASSARFQWLSDGGTLRAGGYSIDAGSITFASNVTRVTAGVGDSESYLDVDLSSGDWLLIKIDSPDGSSILEDVAAGGSPPSRTDTTAHVYTDSTPTELFSRNSLGEEIIPLYYMIEDGGSFDAKSVKMVDAVNAANYLPYYFYDTEKDLHQFTEVYGAVSQGGTSSSDRKAWYIDLYGLKYAGGWKRGVRARMYFDKTGRLFNVQYVSVGDGTVTVDKTGGGTVDLHYDTNNGRLLYLV